MDEFSHAANNSLQILPDGIIELTQRGFQTVQSISQFRPSIEEMTKTAHAEGKKALILVNLADVTGHSPEARSASRDQIKGDYDALAIYGSDLSVKMVVNWIIGAFGGSKIRFFDEREPAIQWLHERGNIQAK